MDIERSHSIYFEENTTILIRDLYNMTNKITDVIC